MSQCPTLKYLDLRSLKLQIFLLPEATNRFEYLCELTCDTSMESTYFSGIASICQNIQRLIIINSSPEDNEGLANTEKLGKVGAAGPLRTMPMKR
ncbi:14346_t:CDS:2 [Funneliformis geosporum]|nr:14346_t:CDS:2 [Funneliformis geosporum]